MDAGESAAKGRPADAEAELRALAIDGDVGGDGEVIKRKEQAIAATVESLAARGDAEGLRRLMHELRPLYAKIAKAKTAKIVRQVIDAIAKIPGTKQLQVEVCKEQAEWARSEKRTFLRQRIEARLVNLYLETKEFTAALELIQKLLMEVKRLDDKLLLVDIHLLESRIHHALRNLPKAKAALTAARTAANSIYVPPATQSSIDSQSGVLHAEEKDYKTAYSYFFEAFEQQSTLDDPRAILSFKYMLLSKIMCNQADDVANIISSKGGLKYQGVDVDAMQAVATSYTKRSLHEFERSLRDYDAQLGQDPIIQNHLNSLYNTLLEQNLCRLIEPYSRVEIAHLAQRIELPEKQVEVKLSQMILDKVIDGTLDQGAGCLIIFDEIPPNSLYPEAIDTMKNMEGVVASLFRKSEKLAA